MEQIRKLEMFVAIMVFTMAASFFAEMSFVKPPAADLLKGLFVPKLSGQTATGDAIALLGALIMPHNLFLHSALEVCRYYLMETGFALFVALLINIAVTSVSATVWRLLEKGGASEAGGSLVCLWLMEDVAAWEVEGIEGGGGGGDGANVNLKD
ncbi:hypothetical protein C3L33_17630, partial [Rhododendron williamsianum]